MGFLDNMAKRTNQLAHAWNAFRDGEAESFNDLGYSNYASTTYGNSRPDRVRLMVTNERSMISSMYTRIAIDFSQIIFKHVMLDENEQYSETIRSALNNCLTLEANIDQSSETFFRDFAFTLFDKGVAAIVPVDTSTSPGMTAGGFDIHTMRVGHILAWHARHVRVSVWDDREGRRKEVVVPKANVAIIENPLYQVMNEPNSTLQRLIRKLNLLDAVDEQTSAGKLDIIIQLPYAIKSESRRSQAEARRKDIEVQMTGSKYGIAYADATEKITQLNRPAENNMLAQIEYLTDLLYGQLGLTKAVFDGSASEVEMLNYNNRTIEPIAKAFALEMKRKFLTKTARTQGQSIEYFLDPFKLVPISDLAELADKLTRNEILSSNEFRGIIGFRPSSDPNANKLINKNLPAPAGQEPIDQGHMPVVPTKSRNDQLALEQ